MMQLISLLTGIQKIYIMLTTDTWVLPYYIHMVSIMAIPKSKYIPHPDLINFSPHYLKRAYVHFFVK